MSFKSPFLQPAKLLSYDAVNRTAQVSIAGLTDGASDGITAMIAYPIGDNDKDTERELLAGADVWVFFEQGDTTMPVIAFYRRHGQGLAVVDVRRIRQKNIEVLARANLTLDAGLLVDIKAKTIKLTGDIVMDGNIKHTGNNVQSGNHTVTGNISVNGSQTITGESVSNGNQTINGSISATGSIKSAGVSLSTHTHGGVRTGGDSTSTPT